MFPYYLTITVSSIIFFIFDHPTTGLAEVKPRRCCVTAIHSNSLCLIGFPRHSLKKTPLVGLKPAGISPFVISLLLQALNNNCITGLVRVWPSASSCLSFSCSVSRAPHIHPETGCYICIFWSQKVKKMERKGQLLFCPDSLQ